MNEISSSARLKRWGVGIAMIATAILIATIDYLTRSEVSVALFYLLPISVLTWFVGSRPGLFLCFLCATARLPEIWFASRSFSHPSTPYWNAAVELGFFLFAASVLSKLRSAMAGEATLARTDPLTGVLNRRAFMEIATREVARAERYGRSVSVAYLDVDDFKRVNDMGGHEAGDFLLVRIAETLRDNLRACDTVARYGGDEFLILLPETDVTAIGPVLGKLTEALRPATQGRWPASVSVGAITIDAPRTSLERLIHQADALVYLAKQDGKNRVRYLHLDAEGSGVNEDRQSVGARWRRSPASYSALSSESRAVRR